MINHNSPSNSGNREPAKSPSHTSESLLNQNEPSFKRTRDEESASESESSFQTAVDFDSEDYDEFNKSNPDDSKQSQQSCVLSNFSIPKKDYGKTLSKIWNKKNDGSSKVIQSTNRPTFFRGKKVIGFNPVLNKGRHIFESSVLKIDFESIAFVGEDQGREHARMHSLGPGTEQYERLEVTVRIQNAQCYLHKGDNNFYYMYVSIESGKDSVVGNFFAGIPDSEIKSTTNLRLNVQDRVQIVENGLYLEVLRAQETILFTFEIVISSLPFKMPNMTITSLAKKSNEHPVRSEQSCLIPLFYVNFFTQLKLQNEVQFVYEWKAKKARCEKIITEIFVAHYNTVKDTETIQKTFPGCIQIDVAEGYTNFRDGNQNSNMLKFRTRRYGI